MSVPLAPVEIFFSFAEADASLFEQMVRHLSVLRQEGLISLWHKRQIVAGHDWQVELDRHLNTASLILLLISPDFLASDYQYGVELRRAMERHNENEALVIPILLRPCDWKGAPFEKLQMVPRNGTPLSLWRSRDAGFAEVAAEIRAALEDLPQLTLAALPTIQPKIWQIPYQRNPVFTGREDLLQHLTETLQTKRSAIISQPQTQAISGLGGAGKTQLAVEYAYRTMQHYQAVFWVSAETQETLVSGYVTLARAINLQERDESDQNVIVNAVRQWLHTHTSWLLILDNADDLTGVEPFLPPTYGGHVLLTTRAQATGRFAQRLEIGTLTNEDGALLLLRRAAMLAAQGQLEEAAEQERLLARMISEELGDLPLALDQAGAYVEETRCSLQSYQQQYQHRRAALLARRGGFALDHPEAIATTWSLSFEKVEQNTAFAADLLRFCAFLAPDAIPEELLVSALTLDIFSMEQFSDREGVSSLPPGWQSIQPDHAYQAEASGKIDEAVAVLRAYSLIQRDIHEKTLSVHRLVQAVLQDHLSEQKRHMWIKRISIVISAAFPYVEQKTWKVCERYLPHALFIIKMIEQEKLLHNDVELLLCTLPLVIGTGQYLYERARYAEAEAVLVWTQTRCERQLSRERLETGIVLNILAGVYNAQGKYEQAESLSKRVLTIYGRQLGSEDSHTANALKNLAELYWRQGKYEQAEPLYQQALIISQRVSGYEHPDIASILNHLALLYSNQGKFRQAEAYCEQALKICERCLEPEHHLTTSILHTLATIYERQNKYEQAERVFEHTAELTERLVGPEHPDTSSIFSNLAQLYTNQGRYGEAESLYQRSLATSEQQLGPEHPETAVILSNLASLYTEQGKYQQAEPLYQRALLILEQHLGVEHSETAMVLSSLASLYTEQGKYQQAEALCKHALMIKEQQLGSEHTSIATTLNLLAEIYRRQHKYGQAEPLYQRALTMSERLVGPEHLTIATALSNLALLYCEQGKYEQAEPLYQQALTISERLVGPEHPITMNTLVCLATLYQSQGKYEQAEAWYKRVLAINERISGPQHPRIAIILNNLAALYRDQRKYREAEPLFKEALEIAEQQGSMHPDTVRIRENYMDLLRRMREMGFQQTSPKRDGADKELQRKARNKMAKASRKKNRKK